MRTRDGRAQVLGDETPWYFPLLRCPDCLGRLETSAGTMTCLACGFVTGLARPLVLRPARPRRGVLEWERRVVAVEETLATLEISAPRISYSGPRAIRDSSQLLSALPSPSAADDSRTVLDLGCGPRDQAPCFEHLGYRYVGVDYGNQAADVRADAHFLPFASAAFSCVFSYAVLEHLYNPWVALAEITRVLEPGGLLLGTVSQGEPFHSSYFHQTTWGLLSLVAQTPGLRVVRVWGSGSDTLGSLATMGRYPRAIRALLWLVDRVHGAAPWLAPRRMGWPARERELDRLHRAGSLCFLIAKEEAAISPGE